MPTVDGEIIELHVNEDIDMSSEEDLNEYLNEEIEELQRALDLRANDDRARIENIWVDQVTITPDSCIVEYNFDWSAYYGCEDRNVYDAENHGTVTGEVNGRTLLFKVFVYPPERTTFEEF